MWYVFVLMFDRIVKISGVVFWSTLRSTLRSTLGQLWVVGKLGQKSLVAVLVTLVVMRWPCIPILEMFAQMARIGRARQGIQKQQEHATYILCCKDDEDPLRYSSVSCFAGSVVALATYLEILGLATYSNSVPISISLDRPAL